jgi:hypothetical protein
MCALWVASARAMPHNCVDAIYVWVNQILFVNRARCKCARTWRQRCVHASHAAVGLARNPSILGLSNALNAAGCCKLGAELLMLCLAGACNACMAQQPPRTGQLAPSAAGVLTLLTFANCAWRSSCCALSIACSASSAATWPAARDSATAGIRDAAMIR